MGGIGSTIKPTELQALQALCSAESFPPDAPVWQCLSNIQSDLALLAPPTSHAVVSNVCDDFATNNKQTHNFETLISHVLHPMSSDRATSNLLVIARTLFKSLAEEYTVEELFGVWGMENAAATGDGDASLVELQPGTVDGSQITLLQRVIDLCHTLISTAAVGNSLHIAACDLLLAFVSVPVIADVLVCAPYGGRLAILLLQQILPAPTQLPRHSWRIARWAETLMQLPSWLGAVKALLQRKHLPWPVSADERAALLLLALLMHPHPQNEAAAVVATVRDPDDAVAADHRISFKLLYNAISRLLAVDAGVLLLYSLLYRNDAFIRYVLARTDIDMLVVPLLRQLYDGRGKHPHQLYMPLITLLMLSQHAPFHAQLHAHAQSSDVGWFKERRLETVDLGSLVMIVVIRTVLRNFTALRDVYLNTNCLALLGNMARYVHDLHPYAADRLLQLVRVLFKRVSRLTEPTELDMYTEFLRLSVQIVHACLCATLQRNAHLIYTLMQHAELLESLCALPAVAESAAVLRDVTAHFTPVVVPSEDLSIADALSAINSASKSIHIAPAPVLNFTYSEDADSAEFFGPYVLALVAGYMGWDALPARLAQLTEVQVTPDESAPSSP